MPWGVTRVKTILNFVRVTPRGVTRLKTILNFVRVTPWGITRLKTILNLVRVKPRGVTHGDSASMEIGPLYGTIKLQTPVF